MTARLTVLVLALAAAAGYLGFELRSERNMATQLHGELDALKAHPPPAVLPDDELIRRFNVLYYTRRNWDDTSWIGVKTLQNPPDMWSIQEILCEVRPDYVIEAGTYAGGSAVYMAMVLEAAGVDAKVLTIDIKPRTEEAEKLKIWKDRIEFFLGSSTDPALVAKLAERVKGKKVVVMLDSDHSRDHVFEELNAYGPMVSLGSYLIVQDTNTHGHPAPGDAPGPWEAVHDFLPHHPEFQIDRAREKFLVTFTPEGYLKKVAPSP